MKKFSLLSILLTTLLLCACTSKINNNVNVEENIDENIPEISEEIEESGIITFTTDDSAEIIDAKWWEYVNTAIALEWDECTIHTFAANWIYYWVYNCHQPSTDPEFTDLDRSGILELVADNRILTCNEANGEQWAWYDEEKFWKIEDKTCAEIQEYIEKYFIWTK